MNLEELKILSGIGSKKHQTAIDQGSNVSLTGMEKSALMKKHNIKPGTPEWFQLWFSRPYLTGEPPIGK
jgi:hypothetical protein